MGSGVRGAGGAARTTMRPMLTLIVGWCGASGSARVRRAAGGARIGSSW
jgi:hypothetical protein